MKRSALPFDIPGSVVAHDAPDRDRLCGKPHDGALQVQRYEWPTCCTSMEGSPLWPIGRIRLAIRGRSFLSALPLLIWNEDKCAIAEKCRSRPSTLP